MCASCGATFESEDWNCSRCGFMPRREGEHLALAPASTQGSEGFKESYFDELASLEAKNFWFRGRNRLILWAMQRYFPSPTKMLEIGCGTGFVLAAIEKAYP